MTAMHNGMPHQEELMQDKMTIVICSKDSQVWKVVDLADQESSTIKRYLSEETCGVLD